MKLNKLNKLILLMGNFFQNNKKETINLSNIFMYHSVYIIITYSIIPIYYRSSKVNYITNKKYIINISTKNGDNIITYDKYSKCLSEKHKDILNVILDMNISYDINNLIEILIN